MTKTSLKGYEGILVLCLVSIVGNGLMIALKPFLYFIISLFPGGHSEINLLFLTSCIQVSLIVFGVWLVVKKIHQGCWADIGLRPLSHINWLWSAIANGIVLFFSMILMTSLLQILLSQPVPPQNITTIISGATTSWEKLVPILVTGLMAPISEELLFRGLIFNGLCQRFDVKISILITACIFGFMHFDLIRAIPLMLGGVWLNVIYVRSQSLYAAMIAHSVWNIAMTMTIYFI